MQLARLATREDVLAVCGSISLTAMLAYLPLVKLLPPPAKKELKLEPMETYEAMPPVDFMMLPLQLRWMISQERVKMGKPHIMHGWGQYSEQVPHLSGLVGRSMDDFAFMKSLNWFFLIRPEYSNRNAD